MKDDTTGVVEKTTKEPRSWQQLKLHRRSWFEIVFSLGPTWFANLCYMGFAQALDTIVLENAWHFGPSFRLTELVYFSFPLSGSNVTLELVRAGFWVSVVTISTLHIVGTLSRFMVMPKIVRIVLLGLSAVFYRLICASMVGLMINSTNCLTFLSNEAGSYEIDARGNYFRAASSDEEEKDRQSVNIIFPSIRCNGEFAHKTMLFSVYAYTFFFICFSIVFCALVRHRKNYSKKFLMSMPFYEGLKVSFQILVVVVKTSSIGDHGESSPLLQQLILPALMMIVSIAMALQVGRFIVLPLKTLFLSCKSLCRVPTIAHCMSSLVAK